MTMKVILDARLMNERIETHMYLKRHLQLPEYYGNNLDALYDCLSEFNRTIIKIKNCNLAGDYFDKIYCVMLEAEKTNDELTIILLDNE